jgi:S-adenosylmethionine hydrolase
MSGPAAPPIVTLTTDFGRADPWAGVMKGVILGICPSARLVDLTHEVPPHDVAAGQLALEAAVPYFPPGTVHLAVIDPGVGSARRPLLVEAGGQRFVGPDNGLFTFALDAGGSAVALESPALRLATLSRTFHGRDVFAPAAAHAALGLGLPAFGSPVTDPVRAPLPRARRDGADVVGEVLAADHFGNLVTSIRAEDLDAMGQAGVLRVALDGADIGPLREAYADGPRERPAAIVGSGGRLEIFVREGRAVASGAGRGTPVRVGRRSAL